MQIANFYVTAPEVIKMLKLCTFCAITAVVASSTVKNLIGTWYAVEFFPSLFGTSFSVNECQPHVLEAGKTYMCNGMPTESVSYTFAGIQLVSPVIFVNSHSEALTVLNKEYNCEGAYDKPTIFKVIDKDHFLTYVGKKNEAPFPLFRLLFARKIPSVSELKAYVATVDDLSNTSGDIVCTSSDTPTT